MRDAYDVTAPERVAWRAAITDLVDAWRATTIDLTAHAPDMPALVDA